MNNTNNPKVSVIIPVYNVEQYLDRCINSIIHQTYANLEIILVDDGSTDTSGYMCDEWKQKDSRISIIHKENAGLGFARNSGLEIITGDYVSFVDSDDYIKLDAYEKLIKRLKESNADVCYFGCDYDDHGDITVGSQKFPLEVYDKKQIDELLLPISFGKSIQKKADKYGIGSVCCGIYRSRLFSNLGLRFGSEREVLCEDILFTSELLTSVESVAFVNENFYYYCYNGSSLTHSFRKDRFEKSQKFYILQIDLIREKGLSRKCLDRAKNSFLINIIVCLKQELSHNSLNYCKSKETILVISNNELFRKIYESSNIRELNIKKQLLFFCLYHRLAYIVYFFVSHNK